MELFTTTHKQIFRNIHNFLAGRFVGATRERALLDEVIKCLFCKVYLENLQVEVDQFESIIVSKKYRETFTELKNKIPDIFSKSDEILLDPDSIKYFDEQISKVELNDPNRDPFGDLYEVFIGTGVREEEGQFFTPKNGIELLIRLIAPKGGERIIDPACGAGGFLTATISYLRNNGVALSGLQNSIVGIDKDEYLANLAKVHIALKTLSSGYTYCGNSLSWKDTQGQQLKPVQNDYDIVLTNPPFGKKIVAVSKEDQTNFELGYSWKLNKNTKRYVKSNKLQRSVPPQVLFVEKCIALLKEGGRLGIVLPESLLTSSSYSYVVQYIHDTCDLISVMGMPEDFFKTSGKGGTHTKACLVVLRKRVDKASKRTDDKIFMAEAKWCGHDSRGRTIEFDDLPIIAENFEQFKNGSLSKYTMNGYVLSRKGLNGNILSPRYYNPEIDQLMKSLAKTHDILTMGKLLVDGVIDVKTGDEVGKLAYGTGNIPFVRTSDISSWEVKLSPKHGVSEEIFEKYKSKQNVLPNDILMVKDGTYLIGTCAILTEHDSRIIYQSHLYKIRVLKPEVISPFLLLAVLSSNPVKQQIKSKRFTQDIIDSLGKRIYELKLPIPKSEEKRNKISQTVEKVITDRITARELAREACLTVVEV